MWFDRNMKFDTNITKMCVMGHFYLYNISRRIRKHLTYESARALTRLDYCNSLLYGCSDGQINHTTPLMFKLHWLPVELRIKYKILLMTFKAIHGLSTDYIQSPAQVKKKSRFNLRSNDEL